ncbi:MAG TPA: hypothetical protein VL991_14085 [Terracidiphilus sp.]|jgi:hypothetical protein|nr:hypothetical protein [Terracidiphilus sp.]
MRLTLLRPEQPELKELLVEASKALAVLDAERLEGLALCCQALARDLAPMSESQRDLLRQQARAAVDDMAVFARVLEATRANVQVMRRLRALRSERLEYGQWGMMEDGRGHD